MTAARDWTTADLAFMGRALTLAHAQMGHTGVNPAVGCVIVRDGLILGEGATATGGRPHGEAVALQQADAPHNTQGACLYVTLEPCAHQSPRGPTCCQIIAQSGITHVIAALEDPDPRTSGQGFAHLISAGIKVETGLLASEAQAIMANYLARVGG